jgi:hypothetical protein
VPSFSSDILEIHYPALADRPQSRLTCLRLAIRLVGKRSGLYSRTRLHADSSAWPLLLDWIRNNDPEYLRVEKESVRVLEEYTGHVLIGTTLLISDLDDTLETINEPPPLATVWQAAKRATK